jgi:lipopolysaccharide exporter
VPSTTLTSTHDHPNIFSQHDSKSIESNTDNINKDKVQHTTRNTDAAVNSESADMKSENPKSEDRNPKSTYWLTSGFYTLLDKLTQMVFGLGGSLILFKILDKSTAGVWVIFMALTAMIEVSRTGLLQNGMVTFLNTTEKEEHPRIITASVILNFGLSALVVTLLLLGSTWLGKVYGSTDLANMLKIYALTTFILSGLYQFNFVQQANLDYKGLFLSSFVKNGILFGYILYLTIGHRGISITNLAYCQLIAAIPATLVAFSFARKYLHFNWNWDFSKGSINRNWIAKLLNYGKYTFGTNVATMVYKNVDRSMLGSFPLFLSKVSTYDLAIKVNTLAEVPTTTLATILFPQSAKRSHEDGLQSAKYLYEKSVGILLALILPMVVFVLAFAPFIIKMLLLVIKNKDYADASSVLRLTIFFGVFMAFAIQFGTVVDSVGKPKLNFWITSLGAIVNLVTNYIFISKFGFYGACYGSLVAMSIMFIVMQIVLYKVLGVRILNVFTYMKEFYKSILNRCRR